MTKQLVVVVHGVGVKEAGVSSDLLATALDDNRLLPEASDDFHVNEIDDYVEDSKRKIFPCRIRRYSGNGNERVIADFYWGDISNSGSGTLGLLIAIVKTVLGIGHTVRESAKDIYGADSWLARIADWIVRLIHGPIAAINLVMFSGAAAYWGLGKLASSLAGSPTSPSWIAELAAWVAENCGAVVALLAIALGMWRYGAHKSFLGRLLYSWVILTGLLLLGSEAFNTLEQKPGWLLQIDKGVKEFVCREKPVEIEARQQSDNESALLCRQVAKSCGDQGQCERHLASGIFVSGGRLLALANLAWVAALVLNAVLVAHWAARRNSRSVPMLAPVATSGMIVLWMLFLIVVWTAPTAMGWRILPHDDMLESGLIRATVIAAILLALIVAAVVVTVLKGRWKMPFAKVPNVRIAALYFGDRKTPRAKAGIATGRPHRLIVNRWFALTFCIGACVLAIVYLMLWIDIFWPGWFLHSQTQWLGDNLRASTLVIGWLLGVGGVALVSYFRAELKMGVDILTDVITYLNDYDWRWGGKPSRTALEHSLGRLWPRFKGMRGSEHLPRNRIKDRLKVLLAKLLAEEKPDELFLVSHSQGTVIALDVIKDASNEKLKEDKVYKPSCPVSLVTMGSPWTHIHGFYFPSSFPPVKIGDTLLTKWTNIFRVDDFVGTHIDPEGIWPVEHPVPPNGHTYYWIDTNVASILKDALKFGSGKPVKRLAGEKGKR